MPLDTIIFQDESGNSLSTEDLLNYFINEKSKTRNITDLHLKAGSVPAFRIYGELKKINGSVIDASHMYTIYESLVDSYTLEQLEAKSSIDTSFTHMGVSFRANCFYDSVGPAIAIRALEPEPLRIHEIGFPNRVWEDIVTLKQGLVLFTGPTGAGKTTTIASLVNQILKERACRVITLEDPIEYKLDDKMGMVSHREIGTHVSSFAQGLRDAMREDPDIIVIGEMRDPESAALALSAAETGHLIFSTLHTRDTQGALTRIIDMLTESNNSSFVHSQLSLSLRYIITQRLIPHVNKENRVLAMEILNNIHSVANTIRNQKYEQLQNIMQTHMQDISEERMITLDQSLKLLLENEVITRDTALEWANDPTQF